jgi:hypothetical protein
MIDISFEFNGKKVDPNKLGDALEQAVIEAATKAIIDRVGSVRCPKHGQYAKIVCTGLKSNDLKFNVSGCCQELTEEVKSKLEG